jgi:hypothetical protein
VWDSGRVSLDGITFTSVTSDEIRGYVNDGTRSDAPFVLKIHQRIFDGPAVFA